VYPTRRIAPSASHTVWFGWDGKSRELAVRAKVMWVIPFCNDITSARAAAWRRMKWRRSNGGRNPSWPVSPSYYYSPEARTCLEFVLKVKGVCLVPCNVSVMCQELQWPLARLPATCRDGMTCLLINVLWCASSHLILDVLLKFRKTFQ